MLGYFISKNQAYHLWKNIAQVIDSINLSSRWPAVAYRFNFIAAMSSSKEKWFLSVKAVYVIVCMCNKINLYILTKQ